MALINSFVNASIGAGSSGTSANNKPTSSEQNNFKSEELLEDHYQKHKNEIGNALDKANYTKQDYVNDANYILENGTYVEELNGYV